jgi:Tfp pilus assembly protein PilO
MNIASSKVERLDRIVALRLGFAGITTLAVLLTWLGIAYLQRKVGEVETDAAAHRELMQHDQSLQASVHKLNNNILTLQQAIESVQVKLPASAEETQFLQQLSERATATGVALGEFRPGSVTNRRNHKEIELRLRGTGTYAAVARWLHSLRDIPRIVRIADLNITAPTQPGGNCTAEIRIDLLFGLSLDHLADGRVN